jgi:uncharacterized iron-regulated protein
VRLTAILATLAAGAACAAAPLELADHPLAGRIWDVAAQRFVDVEEARARAARADYLLLGETHDNARHHELQAALVGEMVTRGHRPAIVMEPIDREHQGALDSAVAAGTGAAELGAAAQVSRGWDWALYAPIVALALAHRLPLVAGNLSSADARKVASGGFEAVQPGAARSLGIEAAWTGERAKVLRHELVAGHCGEDGPRIDAMALMQRARDAVLADRILSNPRAVAILGRGHARADIGVPLYLRERAPGKGVLSLAFVEVRRDAERPGDYDEATPGRHDLAWFTPRAGRADPCAAFKARPKPAP